MDLRISSLLNAYRSGATTPRAVIEYVLDEMEKAPAQIWISRLSKEALEKYLEPLEKFSCIPENMPLFGIPFAIKDNIDVEGLKSTSASAQQRIVRPSSLSCVRKSLAEGI